jgi:16S rRNA (cytosine967-C5)-methyltransferase
VVEVVGDLLAALPRATADHDPRLLAAAARPGRIRDTALRLHQSAIDHPTSADGRIRRGLREARYLHSRERRLVADGIHGLLRHGEALAAALEDGSPLTRWLGWLVHQGLPPADALEAWAETQSDSTPPFAAARDLPGTLAPLLEAWPPEEAVALVGSLTPACGAALLRSLGTEVGAFLAASNTRALVTLRAQRTRMPRDDLARRLADEGFATTPTRYARDGLHVTTRGNITDTAAWREGLFEVQDGGSQLVATLVEPQGLVVDFCAGAGGKTLAMSAAMTGGRIVAADIRAKALSELQRRAKRAGAHNVQTCVLPRTGPLPGPLARARADRVLVDAPCSGTGVLRRHPAYRLRITGEALSRHPADQRAILDRAAALVAPGGRLVYATCSVLREENEAVVEDFLSAHPQFAPMPAREVLGADAKEVGDGNVLRVLPHIHGTDGFFAAVLMRT